MKVSDIIIYIVKIKWRDFKKIRLSRFRDIQKALKVQICKEVALIQVVGAGVFFRRENVLLAKAHDETRKEGRK